MRELTPEKREAVARAIHERYRANQEGRKPSDDPALAPWDALPETLKESNRDQADHVVSMLERIGRSVHEASRFTDEEIEVLAELEHARWVEERLRDGWTLGPRDPERKLSPHLVPWSELPEDVREYDRETVRAIPEYLAEVGLEVRREPGSELRPSTAPVRVLEGHAAGVTGCAVTGDGTFLVSASVDGTLKLWDPGSGEELRTLVGHEGPVTAVAVAPAGEFVVSAGRDRTLKLWDPRAGEALQTFAGHTDAIEDCAVSADGSFVVSACWDGTLKLWDVASGQERATLLGHSAQVHGCVIGPGGDLVVSASSDGTLRLWDATTGREQAVLVGHNPAVWSCAVDPGGRFVVSGGQDGTARIWDPASARELAVLRGHVGGVHGCAVSPDGERVVSAGQDGTLRVWRAEGGDELERLEGHGGPVWDCAISPRGTYVVSAGSDGTLRVWDLRPDDERAGLLFDMPAPQPIRLRRATPRVQGDDELADLEVDRLPAPASEFAESYPEVEQHEEAAAEILERAVRRGAPRELRTRVRREWSRPVGSAATAQPSPSDLAAHLSALQSVVERGDPLAQAGALSQIGVVYARAGELSQALAHQEQALRIFREMGAHDLEAASVRELAALHHGLGDHHRALAFGHEALELSRRLSSREDEAASLAQLGVLCDSAGRLGEALDFFESAARLNAELGNRLAEAGLLSTMTRVFERLGLREDAARAWAEAERIRSEQGVEPVVDVVDCTAFAPPRIVPGDELLIQVFAHTWEQTDAAVALAQEFDVDAERRGFTTLEVEIAPETSVTFHLAMPTLVVREAVRSLVWRRRPASVQFAVVVPWDHKLGTATGKVTVCVDDIPRGEVTFKLDVVSEEAHVDREPVPVGDDGRHYTLAFISYASEDLDAALHCVQVLRAAGIGYFQDILGIEPGKRWEEGLVTHINECDLFLLVWSQWAKDSDWVEKEFDLAMGRKEDDDLAPPAIGLYVLEDGVEPWAKYSGMHFRDPVVYMRRGARAR